MIETIANTTAGITKSRKKPPTPIVMQPVINSRTGAPKQNDC